MEIEGPGSTCPVMFRIKMLKFCDHEFLSFIKISHI